MKTTRSWKIDERGRTVPITGNPGQVFSGDKQTSSIHDTQKPLALIKYLIKTYTDEGDWVHDSCLGSGTVLKACEDLNRNCIGFEITDAYEEHY